MAIFTLKLITKLLIYFALGLLIGFLFARVALADIGGSPMPSETPVATVEPTSTPEPIQTPSPTPLVTPFPTPDLDDLPIIKTLEETLALVAKNTELIQKNAELITQNKELLTENTDLANQNAQAINFLSVLTLIISVGLLLTVFLTYRLYRIIRRVWWL